VRYVGLQQTLDFREITSQFRLAWIVWMLYTPVTSLTSLIAVMIIVRLKRMAITVLIGVIYLLMFLMIVVVIMMNLTVVWKRVVVLRRWGKLGGRLRRWLRLANRGPAGSIPSPVPAVIGCWGFGPASCFAIGWVDGVAAAVAVATLGNIRDD